MRRLVPAVAVVALHARARPGCSRRPAAIGREPSLGAATKQLSHRRDSQGHDARLLEVGARRRAARRPRNWATSKSTGRARCWRTIARARSTSCRISSLKGSTASCWRRLDSTALVPIGARRQERRHPHRDLRQRTGRRIGHVSYVATDNYRGGALAAREIGKRLDGKGNVILLRYNVGSESTEQREQGFLETLQKGVSRDRRSCPTISTRAPPPLEAQNKALRAAQPVRRPAERHLRRLRARHDGRAGRTRAGGPGRQGEVHRLRSRARSWCRPWRTARSTAWCCRIPVAMGYQSVKTLVAHLQGEKVEKRIPTGEVDGHAGKHERAGNQAAARSRASRLTARTAHANRAAADVGRQQELRRHAGA